MRVFLSALVMIVALASVVPAQEADDRFSVLSCGLLYLDDAAFRKEAALTPAQITALTGERDRLMTAYGKMSVFAVMQQAGALSTKTDREILGILDEKQAVWRQLVLQDCTRRFGAYRTLRLPEVRTALKLSADQVSRLEKGEDVASVLSTEQQRHWQRIRGDILAQPLTVRLPPELVVSWPSPLESDHLQALALPSVQEELKLDDEQRKQLGKLRHQWLLGRQELRRAAPERQVDMGKDLLARTDKGLSEVLTKEQRTRLDQITRQLRLPRGLPFTLAPFLDETTLNVLNLSKEQRSSVEKQGEERRTLLGKAAESADTIAEFTKAIDAVNKQMGKALEGILDSAQKQRLESQFGKPFMGRRVPVNIDTLQPDLAAISTEPLLLRLLPYLQKEGLSAELHIGAGQKKELAALERSFSDQVISAADSPTQKEREQKRTEAYAGALKSMHSILQAEQRTRLGELMLQYLESVQDAPPEFRLDALAQWPEMVKELELTPGQLARLDDAVHIRQVLTAEQWKKWQQLRGKPSPLIQSLVIEDLTVPLPARLNYLEEPTIRAELKLSDEQLDKLRAGMERWSELALRSTVWSPAERKEKIPALKKQIHDELFALLTAEQAKRLAQIGRRQWLKEEGLPGLFEIADTEEALKWTAEQQLQVHDLMKERALIDRIVRQQRLQFGTVGSELAFWGRLHSADRGRLAKLLTEEQKKTLAELLGEPFDHPLTPHALRADGREADETRLFGFAPPR